MATIEKILVPVDGSAISLGALDYASSLVSEDKAVVYLIAVIEANSSMYDAYQDKTILARRRSQLVTLVNERLKNAEEKAKEVGIPKTIKVIRIGTPHQRIVEMATEAAIDMIVMGTHGRSGIARFLSGSVTEMVIRAAPCPVLVVRPSGESAFDN